MTEFHLIVATYNTNLKRVDIYGISIEKSNSRIDSKIIIGYEKASPSKATFLPKEGKKNTSKSNRYIIFKWESIKEHIWHEKK
jgi:hypothetical protein